MEGGIFPLTLSVRLGAFAVLPSSRGEQKTSKAFTQNGLSSGVTKLARRLSG